MRLVEEILLASYDTLKRNEEKLQRGFFALQMELYT